MKQKYISGNGWIESSNKDFFILILEPTDLRKDWEIRLCHMKGFVYSLFLGSHAQTNAVFNFFKDHFVKVLKTEGDRAYER